MKAEVEVCRDRRAEFPYDLAEFVSPWQGFGGGDSFFTGKRSVADRKVTEIAGISARGQSGDWALIGGVTVGRHVVTFFFPGAVSSKQVRADAAVELCGGALIKLCCEPALKAGLCVVGPGGLRRPAQVEGGQLDLRCHQLRNRDL